MAKAKAKTKARTKAAAATGGTTAAYSRADVHKVTQNYISSPFKLIRPSLRAMRLNWPAVVVALVAASFAAAALIVAIVSVIVIATYAHNVRAVALAGLITLLLAAVVVIIVIPLVVIVLLESAKGNKLRLRSTLGRCWHYAGRLFGAGILTVLIGLGGLVLLIVPGIVFATWFSLAMYVIVDEDASVFEGLRRSRHLVRGHLVEMLGLYGLNNFVSFVPLLGQLVSIILTLATLASPAVRYLQLKELDAATTEAAEAATSSEPVTIAKPPVHWLNWLVLVLAAISFVVSGYQSIQKVGQITSGQTGAGSVNDSTLGTGGY